MGARGFIHTELEIKIFILYILKRLSGPIDDSELFDIVHTDDAVGYFDYCKCLNDLIDAGLIQQNDDGVIINEKGRKNINEVESSLPFSVRSNAEPVIEATDERIRRSGLIKAKIKHEDTGWTVELSMSDGISKIIELKLLCADEEQARLIRKNFKANAERCYNNLIETLSQN